jgi:hypothetical protein
MWGRLNHREHACREGMVLSKAYIVLSRSQWALSWSIERIVGCSINTVDKLLRDAGEIALAYHDEHMRGVKTSGVECDEIWSFVHAKAKNAPKSSQLAIRPLATAGPFSARIRVLKRSARRSGRSQSAHPSAATETVRAAAGEQRQQATRLA